MADQLNLDFAAPDEPDPTGAREARRRAWVEANRVAREDRKKSPPEAGTDEEDLLSKAAAQRGSIGDAKGFEKWQREQHDRNTDFARRLGLPLGKRVEAVLKNGTTLRGLLSLGSAPKGTVKLRPGPAADRATRTLLPLLVGRTPVTAGEISSCVRIDERPDATEPPPEPSKRKA